MITDKADMVSNWIEENGNPAIEKLTATNLHTAANAKSTLHQKKIPVRTFAQLVDIKSEEIENWLSGKHNFSQKTLDYLMEVLASHA
ncbi:hypothetical protein [Pedobacter sandarakinus]|uniref:hypothetical protein n=1 Tax=Pedobacter sandarakinus TaxID=353156 RepID=UPI0022470FD9|nr:hypothetical protein [Pedobacter sandarakinus]MCX2573637.1 hypothetical protein [Pedobacter sandarakinus]